PLRVGRADVERIDPARRELTLPRGRDAVQDAALGLQGEGDVLAYRELADDAVGAAVLGGVDDAERDRLARLARVGRGARDPDETCADPVHARDRACELGASGAEQPRDAEHLALDEVDIRGTEPVRFDAA